MKQNSVCAQLHELIEADLPAEELERLGRVDALLRAVVRADDRDEEPSRECERVRASISAALDRELSEVESIRTHIEDCASCRAFQADAKTSAAALQAAKTLGALPSQDELLEDTIQLVDQALNAAI